MLEMLLQVVLIVLLLVSIGWSALLHRRLAMLRQGGDGIGRFVGELVGATARAEAAVRDMRSQAQELGRQWQRQRGDSEAAAAELRQLVAQVDGSMRDWQRGSGVTSPSPSPAAGRDGPPAPGRSPSNLGASGPGDAASETSAHERIREAIRALR